MKFGVETGFLVVALVIALIAAVQDVRGRRIANWLNYSGLIAALVVRPSVLGWPGLRSGLLGMLAGSALFVLLFALGGMGGGDVKLMCCVSAWAGTGQIVNLLIAVALAGGVIALIVTLVRGRAVLTFLNSLELIRHHLKSGIKPHPELNVKQTTSARLPFAPAIAAGVLYCISQSF